jgi:virulence-associated protein VapD
MVAARAGVGHNSKKGTGSMYAIVFDLDTQTLEATYGGTSRRDAYGEVRKALKDFGFDWQQGSTYFGNDAVDAITCVLAVQDVTSRFAWFAPSVRDIRMLRIEENNDLSPAIAAIQTRASRAV